MDAKAWPWAKWMYVVRQQAVMVPMEGQAPVYEGLRVGSPAQWDPAQIEYAEFGRVRGTTIGARRAGSAQWIARDLDQLAKLELEPGHLDPVWPSDDDAVTDEAITQRIANQLRYLGAWSALEWTLASDAWLTRTWARHGGQVVEHMANASAWYAKAQQVPVVLDALEAIDGPVLKATLGLLWSLAEKKKARAARKARRQLRGASA